MSWSPQCEGCEQHSSDVPKHLAEASAHLAPLLLSGFHAEVRKLVTEKPFPSK